MTLFFVRTRRLRVRSMLVRHCRKMWTFPHITTTFEVYKVRKERSLCRKKNNNALTIDILIGYGTKWTCSAKKQRSGMEIRVMIVISEIGRSPTAIGLRDGQVTRINQCEVCNFLPYMVQPPPPSKGLRDVISLITQKEPLFDKAKPLAGRIQSNSKHRHQWRPFHCRKREWNLRPSPSSRRSSRASSVREMKHRRPCQVAQSVVPIGRTRKPRRAQHGDAVTPHRMAVPQLEIPHWRMK